MTRHLSDELSDYADRRMSGPALLAWDRHVAVCEHCRYAVAAERRLLTSLRSGPPQVSPALQAMLMSLAGPQPPSPTSALSPGTSALSPGTSALSGSARSGATHAAPVGSDWSIPTAPGPAAPFRLPTVAPSAPALHRSVRRAAALAGLTAGATMAAAWAVGVAGPLATTPSLVPLARLSEPSLTVRSPQLGGVVTVVDRAASAGAGVRSAALLNPVAVRRAAPADLPSRLTPADPTERPDR